MELVVECNYGPCGHPSLSLPHTHARTCVRTRPICRAFSCCGYISLASPASAHTHTAAGVKRREIYSICSALIVRAQYSLIKLMVLMVDRHVQRFPTRFRNCFPRILHKPQLSIRHPIADVCQMGTWAVSTGSDFYRWCCSTINQFQLNYVQNASHLSTRSVRFFMHCFWTVNRSWAERPGVVCSRVADSRRRQSNRFTD